MPRRYHADLCGNIAQSLKALQGYDFMALELIQNADDAGAKALSFDATTTGLVVRNDSVFTSCETSSEACPWETDGDPDGLQRPCNFHAISTMGSGSKLQAPNQTGRFGIGFVSVFQITDTPIVRSGTTEIQLNPVKSEMDESQISSIEGTEFVLPWASGPSEIRDAISASPTPEDVAKILAKEVSGVLRSSLIFLRNLDRVEVRLDGTVVSSVSIVRTADTIILKFGPKEHTEKWLILSRDGDEIVLEQELLTRFKKLGELNRKTTVSVAVPAAERQVLGLLYAYLPTQHEIGIPLHINADFFPHASRQEIVLKGEDHERFWNEAMLSTAAAIIGENFVRLRDILGPFRLWQLGENVRQQSKDAAFGGFWRQFITAARAYPSVRTRDDKWRLPTEVYMPPEGMQENELAAISDIGMNLLHKTQRSFWSTLSKAGVRQLQLSTVVEALESMDGACIRSGHENVKSLWSAVDTMIVASSNWQGVDNVLARLKRVKFLLDVDEQVVSAEEVWRTRLDLSGDRIRRFVKDCPLAHPGISDHTYLYLLIDKYGLNEFANDLSEILPHSEEAAQIIGTDSASVRELYQLVLDLVGDDDIANQSETLKQVVFLYTSGGFVSPSRAQLPSDFVDPTGHFKLVDTSKFPDGMMEFAQKALGVRTLSFHEYIDEHLEEILSLRLNPSIYQSLLKQIVERKNELDEHGTLKILSEREFVRTRAGTFARPEQCMFWNAEVEHLLGDNPARWIDEVWMPLPPVSAKLRDLLEHSMRMPTRPRATDVVERFQSLAARLRPQEVVEKSNRLARYLSETWHKFSSEEKEEIENLADIKFLPAFVDGDLDQENIYAPSEVYRATRAPGFDSQVPIIGLNALRRPIGNVPDILNLLGIPAEPETEIIVRHLRHCMEKNIKPNDLTYAILNERVNDENDLASIDGLKDSRFIWGDELETYLNPKEVFWDSPPFGNYWWRANNAMMRYEKLFRRLGVGDSPGPLDYATLVLEISGKPEISEIDISVHASCLEHLCQAFELDESQAVESIDLLRDKPSLLNVDGEPIWPDDAIWIDKDQLATMFRSALDEKLVKPPSVVGFATRRFFRALGAKPVSEIARLQLAAEPDRREADHESEILHSRKGLLLWLPPDQQSRVRLDKLLSDIQIQLTDDLSVHAEIIDTDPPVRSEIDVTNAFLEVEEGVLHLRASSVDLNEWTSGFKVVFAEIEQYCPAADMKSLSIIAAMIMTSPSNLDAQQTLRNAEYEDPEDEAAEAPVGRELEYDPDHESTDEDPPMAETLSLPDDSDEDIAFGEGERDDQNQLSSTTTSQPPRGRGKPVSAEGASPDKTEVDIGASKEAAPWESAQPSDSISGYGSKKGSNEFGKDNKTGSSSSPTSQGSPSVGAQFENGKLNGNIDGHKSSSSQPKESKSAKTRRSRMLAYVSRKEHHAQKDDQGDANSSELSVQIDAAAIDAVMRYEEQRGWNPVEQDHFNPGFDIKSTSPHGKYRLIEVKGLWSEWTERGTKLSHVQYKMAQENSDEFWIYIVERACDLNMQKVYAIGNPFKKVEEYWFDNNWRSAAEEIVESSDLNLKIGVKVKHHLWGEGTVFEVETKIGARYVKVDFGFQGKKYVPYNSDFQLVE